MNERIDHLKWSRLHHRFRGYSTTKSVHGTENIHKGPRK